MSARRNRKQFQAISFTNEFFQVIHPGDSVVYAGTAYKRTNLTKAVFEGVYVNTAGSVEAVRVGNISHTQFKWNAATKSYSQSDVLRKAVLPLQRVYKLA